LKKIFIMLTLALIIVVGCISCSQNRRDKSSRSSSGDTDSSYQIKEANWFKVGNQWDYEAEYFGKTRKRTHKVLGTYNIDGVECYIMETKEDGVPIQQNYYHVDDKGVVNYIRLLSRINKKVKFDPPQMILSFPLQVNKNWVWNGQFNRGNKGTFKFNVAALEDVEVPAGSFKALKVVMKGSLDTIHAGKAETEMTQWYARDVGLIKTEALMNFKGKSEAIKSVLTSYTLKK